MNEYLMITTGDFIHLTDDDLKKKRMSTLATLDAFFADDEDDPKVNAVQTLSEKIRQRRIQMLVHSYLYYEMDENVVDDYKWQQWADELVELQKQKTVIGFYDEAFSDWTGASGAFLPFDDWVVERAKKLLQLKQINAI